MPALTRAGLQDAPEMVFDPFLGTYVPAPNQQPKTKYFNSPADAMAEANSRLQSTNTMPTVQASPMTVTGATPGGEEKPPGFIGPGEQGPPTLQTSGTGADVSVPNPALPKFLKPSFRQAATDQYGNVKPLDGSTTKLGKLFQILLGAGEGAMAGQAANAETYARTGRNAGIGGGLEGAEVHPFEEAARQQAVQKGNLENQTIQSNMGLLPWMKRAQIGEITAHTNAENQRAAYWQSAAGQKDQATLQQMYAQRVAQVQGAGQDPNQDTGVQQIATAIRESMRQPADKTETPFTVWRQQNPNADVSEYFKLQPEARAEFRLPGGKQLSAADQMRLGAWTAEHGGRPPATSAEVNEALGTKSGLTPRGTPQQFQKLEQDKQKALASAEQMFKVDNDQEALDAAKQKALDDYNTGVTNLGGSTGEASPAAPPSAAKPAAAPAAKPAAAPASKKPSTQPALHPGSSVTFNGKQQQVSEVRRNPKTGEYAYNIGGNWYKDSELQPAQ